jgi:hypothetical protein
MDMCVSIYETYSSISRSTVKSFKGEFHKIIPTKGGNIAVQNSRYKIRIRPPHKLKLTTSEGAKVSGSLVKTQGKTSIIKLHSNCNATIKSIHIDDSADISKEDQEMLAIFKNVFIYESELSYFVRLLFDPSASNIKECLAVDSLNQNLTLMNLENNSLNHALNESQLRAVQTGLDLNSFMTICKGPPGRIFFIKGTGKTTVISNMIQKWFREIRKKNEKAICTARSNIAVKNIAEAFIKIGFLDFVLIVSDEFYIEWHEHLYKVNKQLHERVVSSGNNVPSCKEAAVRLQTLATMKPDHNTTLMIVDEASQTFIGNYVSQLEKISKSLKKIVFFGDEKQLPPFGSSGFKVKSVFDLDLRTTPIFLNKQYRMPHSIAKFLSSNVYGNKLLNGIEENRNPTPIEWIHVKGKEDSQGNTTFNQKEADAVMKISLELHSKGIRMSDLTILTGYDGQRNYITKLLSQNAKYLKKDCLHIASER